VAAESAAIAQVLAKSKPNKKRMLDDLTPFLPQGTVPIIEQMLKDESYHLIVSRPRKTKLGDFRSPRPGETPQLTVNGNLNPFSFLITLVHEIAHLKIWNKHKNKVKPHGSEWKNLYAQLLSEFIGKELLPKHLEIALKNHIAQPKYTTGADIKLSLELRKYDEANNFTTLSELVEGTQFKLGKRAFILGEKLRSRYLCVDVENGKKYRVHGLAQVEAELPNKMG